MSSLELSEQQIQHFKTHDFLILKNLIDQTSLDQWRKQIWHQLEARLSQAESWPRNRSGLDGYQYNPPESALFHHPALASIIQQLGGGEFSAGDGIPIIRWPELEKNGRCLSQGILMLTVGNGYPL